MIFPMFSDIGFWKPLDPAKRDQYDSGKRRLKKKPVDRAKKRRAKRKTVRASRKKNRN